MWCVGLLFPCIFQVERVMTEDPESLAYHNAAKNVFRKTNVGANGKTKRVKGEAQPSQV